MRSISEYFHGDTGRGIAASHQTGWTGAIAPTLALFASTDARTILEKSNERLVDSAGREVTTP